MSKQDPVLRIGLVADIQYGDKDDTFIEERWQRLREAKGKVQTAVDEWKAEKVHLVLHLGDIIDGQDSREKSLQDLDEITKVLGELECPVYHVIGNHCVGRPPELIDRRDLLKWLGGDNSYYKFTPAPGWLFIMLDTTDMALPEMVGWPEDSENAREARAFWEKHTVEELDQLRAWNGGLTQRQLEWLRAELSAARQRGDRVIVAGHHPVGRGCARTLHYAWNSAEIERLLLDCPNVVLAMNGHDHIGGYACHEGLHFVGFEGLVEAPTDSNSYAIMDVFDDRIVINGRGTATSRVLPLRPLEK